MTNSKFAIKTLGCKVNQYEEQLIRERVLMLGLEESAPEEADIFIVNSCTVTAEADRKTEKIIRKVKRENPNAKIFVTGCYAVLEKDIEHLESLPEVSRVIPGAEKMGIPELLGDFFDSGDPENISGGRGVSGLSGHTRAFLKIQDGCSQKCSYCKVNLVRGPSRSKPREEVLEEFKTLVQGGYREIVLTGICLGSWRGPGGESLADLLKEIDRTEGEFRVRLSSIEPNHIDDELIEIIASSEKVCAHLHIPLQSGSDKVLKAMDRRYTQSQFEGLVSRLRDRIPLIGITMDIIAGFPCETDEDFALTRDFILKIRPSRLHVFKYSDRKGTRSFDLEGKVPQDIAKRRVGELIEIGDRLQGEFYGKFIGKDVEVLVESRQKKDVYEGYTAEYARVHSEVLAPYEGKIAKFRIGHVDEEGPFMVPDTAVS